MAKRRAEDTLLHDFPSKKYCRAFCKVSMHLGSMDPTGGVSKPSLLALLGSRGRKRPHYSEDLNKEEQEEETASAVSPCRKDTRMHAASVFSEQTSGSFHDRRSTNSASTKSKKRARDSGSEIVPEDKEKAEVDVNTEDCTYNSFQYWRVPLPELDLSLLEEASNNTGAEDKSKVKDSFSDAMEP